MKNSKLLNILQQDGKPILPYSVEKIDISDKFIIVKKSGKLC